VDSITLLHKLFLDNSINHVCLKHDMLVIELESLKHLVIHYKSNIYFYYKINYLKGYFKGGSIMNKENYYRNIKRILFLILILNISVALAKVTYGWATNSLSMITDGFHSFFDSSSNIIGIIGITIAARPPDLKYPYGHAKFETFASIVIATLLFLTCFEIIRSAIERFFNPVTPEIGILSFLVIGITLLINVAVAWYEYNKGREMNSSILISDSRHTRSDIYASITVILGFIAIKSGYVLADPLIAILIALLIAKTGIEIIKDSSDVLLDKALIDEGIIKNIAQRVDGVCEVHKIRTRGVPSQIYVDLHIGVETSLPIDKAHDVAHNVEDELKRKIESIEDVVVHLESINAGR